MQYAILSSLMTLFPKLLAGYTGGIVDAYGYVAFFVGTAVIGIPVLALVAWVMRHAPAPTESESRLNAWAIRREQPHKPNPERRSPPHIDEDPNAESAGHWASGLSPEAPRTG